MLDLSGKSKIEQISLKADAILTKVQRRLNTRSPIDIEVVDLKKFDKGVEVFIKAWKQGKQIGFGQDRSVDIERVRLIDPDIQVPDPQGPINKDFTDPVTGEIIQNRFREDYTEAVMRSLLLAVKNKQPSDAIVTGRVGNTTTIQPAEADAWLESSGPTGNNNGATMWLGDTDTGVHDASRIVIKFDVAGNISAGQTITSADLSLYNNFESGLAGTETANMYRLRRNWVETEVTWNEYSSGNSWTTAGAGDTTNDRFSTVTTSVSLPAAVLNDFLTWPDSAQFQSDVQDMLDDDANNFGWIIEAPSAENQGASTARARFLTSDDGTASTRPKLVLEHSAASAFTPKVIFF